MKLTYDSADQTLQLSFARHVEWSYSLLFVEFTEFTEATNAHSNDGMNKHRLITIQLVLGFRLQLALMQDLNSLF